MRVAAQRRERAVLPEHDLDDHAEQPHLRVAGTNGKRVYKQSSLSYANTFKIFVTTVKPTCSILNCTTLIVTDYLKGLREVRTDAVLRGARTAPDSPRHPRPDVGTVRRFLRFVLCRAF